MSYPAFTFFKYRALEANTTSTGAGMTFATVPFRAKYLYSVYSPNTSTTIPSATGATTALNISINCSTATADAYFTNPIVVSTSTSTSASAPTVTPAPSVTLWLNQGDNIATTATSGMPYSMVHILQEF